MAGSLIVDKIARAMSDKNPPETFVAFVDMLGFAALVENEDAPHPLMAELFRPMTRIHEYMPEVLEDGVSPLLTQFMRFHTALEERVRKALNKNVIAITFSDSAFVAFAGFADAARFSCALMRDCLSAGVPIRIGLASGTFAALRFLSDTSGLAQVHTSHFLGTSVVRAHVAERCHLKGMRIFLHPSLDDWRLDGGGGEYGSGYGVGFLRLDEPSPHAFAELNYFSYAPPVLFESYAKEVHEEHQKLVRQVAVMRKDAPDAVKHSYTSTINALHRMAAALNDTRWVPDGV